MKTAIDTKAAGAFDTIITSFQTDVVTGAENKVNEIFDAASNAGINTLESMRTEILAMSTDLETRVGEMIADLNDILTPFDSIEAGIDTIASDIKGVVATEFNTVTSTITSGDVNLSLKDINKNINPVMNRANKNLNTGLNKIKKEGLATMKVAKKRVAKEVSSQIKIVKKEITKALVPYVPLVE